MLRGDGPYYQWGALGHPLEAYAEEGRYSHRALAMLPELMEKLGSVRAYEKIIADAKHRIDRLRPQIKHLSECIERIEDRHVNKAQEEES